VKVTKLREILAKVDPEVCEPGLFWNSDKTPCCPLAHAYGPEPTFPKGPGSVHDFLADHFGVSWSEIGIFQRAYDLTVPGETPRESIERALNEVEEYLNRGGS
jgi:hypothetical protein